MIASVNPSTGETIRRFEAHDAVHVEITLQRAVRAFAINRERSFEERAIRLRRTARLLVERKLHYAKLMTLEMGKPIAAAVAEVEKCAATCSFYAEHAQSFLSDEPVLTGAKESFIRYQPLGPVLAVMPWNFPFWQVFRFAAPALMAGNVGLLKHSSNVPQCALAIEEVLIDSDFADGEFQTLLISSDQVAAIVEDERVRAVTLTGSEPAGSSVASTAGRHVKKCVLELGGSDPFIVMPSANLDEAVKIAVKARIVNNGQSCIAAKRFILHESVAAEFEGKFLAAMKGLNVGDPMEETTDIGPLAMPQLVDDLDRQVRESIAAGATLLTGGVRVGKRGNYYAPTVVRDIPAHAPLFSEETFGPVASLFVVHDTAEAITLANATSFGLGASVWTDDRAEAERFIDGIETGQVFVNAMVASDPRVPFGGVKHSGYGRELGVFGIREFINVKTVWIAGMGDAQGSTTE